MKALVYGGPKATICGSDLRATRDGAPPVSRGRILGHEGTGIIERVGDGVTNFQVTAGIDGSSLFYP